MELSQVLRWIVVAIVITIGLMLLNGLLDLLAGLFSVALPILCILLVAAIVLRLVGGRRTR